MSDAIARGRTQPRGVLVQTTHWRHNVRVGIWISWVFGGIFMALLWASAFEPSGHTAGPTGEAMRTALVVIFFAWPWLLARLVLSRVGLEIGPRGYVARRALRRPFPVSAKVPLTCGGVGIWGRRLDDGRSFELYGLAEPGSDHLAVPGLHALRYEHLFYRRCRLVTRPVRPWYRLRARKAVHDDVIWRPDDAEGVAVQLALGFMGRGDVPESAAQPDRFDTKVLRSTGRVKMSSDQIGRGASRLFELTELTALVAVLVVGALTDGSVGLMVVTIFATVAASAAPLVFLGVRSVTVAPGELRIVNGWTRRERLPLRAVRGVLVVPRGRHWAELQVDTDARRVALKALRFRRLDAPQDGDRHLEWRCTPFGAGLRPVATPEDAALLLEAVLRSRGWQQDDPQNPAPFPGIQTRAAQRLERWNRDAA